MQSTSATKSMAASRRNGRSAAKDKPVLKIAGTQNPQVTGGVFIWDEGKPAGTNAVALGRRMASYGDLFRQPGHGNGLVLVRPDGKPPLVTNGPDLAPIIMDRVPVQVMKDGKVKGNKIAAAHLNAMLHAESFLGQFRSVDEVTRTPLFLPGWTLIQPGYNDGGDGHRIYYVGGQPQVSDSMEAISELPD